MRSEISGRYLERIRSNETATTHNTGEWAQFLMDQGIGEATDVLLIDNTRCIRCNQCEQACADVHEGASRLDRNAGQTHQQIHIPASCRHCEHPRCMKDCPPDAIHRSPQGEVFINESCIGCGNCQSSCPYGVIQTVKHTRASPPSLWQIIFGRPSLSLPQQEPDEAPKKAVKCDMCRDIIGGAACVRACPTGAAFRVSPAISTMTDAVSCNAPAFGTRTSAISLVSVLAGLSTLGYLSCNPPAFRYGGTWFGYVLGVVSHC
jgi:Fe-S-cluster-containing dehydrogenase component